MKNYHQEIQFKLVMVFIIFLLSFSGCQSNPPLPPPNTPTPATVQAKNVVITLGSWRMEDLQQMNRILAKFHEKYPNITVNYETYGTTDVVVYNPIIESMLKQGTAPDIFYLTSYSFGQKMFTAGYLEALDDLPGLKDNFSAAKLAPWATKEGRSFGVPYIATSHGIYYNLNIFKKLGLTPPITWEELLKTSKIIKEAGITPFANTSGEGWPMAETVFMNLAPNFIGGYEGRQAYLEGKTCFNDPKIVSVFQAIKDLAPYFPENHGLLNYTDSQQLFIQGKAAMWLGGSWDIPFFENQKPPFEWSVFAVPPPAGQKPYITFHLDAGMGLNANTKHKDEALLFLKWMTSPEFGNLLGNELPGFFPMHSQGIVLENQYANTFLKLNEGRGQDVRFTWEKIMDGSPDAYTIIMDGSIAVLNGKETPQQAADALQTGLEKWFIPAKTCPK